VSLVPFPKLIFAGELKSVNKNDTAGGKCCKKSPSSTKTQEVVLEPHSIYLASLGELDRRACAGGRCMPDLQLIKAAARGKLDEVRRLLGTGHDANERGQAITEAELKALKWVLNEAGVDAVGDAMGRTIDITPLMAASEGGNLEIVEALLTAGADVNAEDSLKRTPLMFAITWKQPVIAMKLHAAGAKVNAKNLVGETVLTQAIAAGLWDLAHVLLDAGASPDPKGKKSCAPLYAAAYRDELSGGPMILRLLEAGATLPDENSLTHAIGRQDADVVERLLESHPALVKKICPDKLLSVAAKARNAKVLETLLERGITPVNDPNERSPLTDTIIGPARSSLDFHKPEFINDEREIKCLDLLVAAGANVNHVAGGETSPLGWAIAFYRSGLVKWLLEHGTNPNLPSHGDSPLKKAHEKLEEAQPTYRLEPHEEDEFHALAAEAKKTIKLLKSHGAKRELEIAPEEPGEDENKFAAEVLNTPVAKRQGLCDRSFCKAQQDLILADIDDISDAVMRQSSVERVERNVLPRLSGIEKPVGQVMALVKLKGQAWVYAAGGSRPTRDNLLKTLSKRLKGRVLRVGEESVSGVLYYQLYDTGKCIESFQSDGTWFHGGVEIDPDLEEESDRMLGTQFTSELRDPQQVDWSRYKSEWEFVDHFLREQDAYLTFVWAGFPQNADALTLTCYHDDERKPENIERVDLVFYKPTAAERAAAVTKVDELLVAIQNRDAEAASEALSQRADLGRLPVGRGDSYLLLAIQYAAKSYDDPVVDLLLDAGADPNFGGQEPIISRLVQFLGASVGSMKTILKLLSHGANIDEQGTVTANTYFPPGGQTALIKAAFTRKPIFVKLLLKCGANPTITDADGKTALDYAEYWLRDVKKDRLKGVPAYTDADSLHAVEEVVELLEATGDGSLDLADLPEPEQMIADEERRLAALRS
jgi:ankyrin repeat protein